MKKKIYILLITAIAAIACTDLKQSSGKKNEPDAVPANAENLKPASGFTDTLFINSPAAVFFAPDSIQWQKLKKITDTMIYASFEHDCFYQMRNARNVLKEYYPRIKIAEATRVRYLLFQVNNDSSQCTDLDKINDPCGVFLFTPKKNPHPADMMNIETELGFYFKD